jgi:hypothetical protein
MKSLKLTAKEWVILCEALDRKEEDFQNYSDEEIKQYVEIEWRLNAINNLKEKLWAINPHN